MGLDISTQHAKQLAGLSIGIGRAEHGIGSTVRSPDLRATVNYRSPGMGGGESASGAVTDN